MKRKGYDRNAAFDRKMAFKAAQAKSQRKFDKSLMNIVVFQMELIMILGLHDEFGFGRKRAQRAITKFETILESFNMNDLTDLKLDDIAEVVRKELKMEVDQEMLDIVALRKRMDIDKYS